MNRATFREGDAVPVHILDVEPVEPSGKRPAMLFSADCDVLDLGEKFIILTASPGHDSSVRIDLRGCTGKVMVFAPTKPVWIMNAWDAFDVRVEA